MPILRLCKVRVQGLQKDRDHGAEEAEDVQGLQAEVYDREEEGEAEKGCYVSCRYKVVDTDSVCFITELRAKPELFLFIERRESWPGDQVDSCWKANSITRRLVRSWDEIGRAHV